MNLAKVNLRAINGGENKHPDDPATYPFPVIKQRHTADLTKCETVLAPSVFAHLMRRADIQEPEYQVADFDLNDIPDFYLALQAALKAVYGHHGDGDPDISIKLEDFGGKIKSTVTANLPDKRKHKCKDVDVFRENGTFRLEKPVIQKELFPK
jgi:hypothetical protein